MGRKKNGSISTTKEGSAFNAIRARCNNPRCLAFVNYGARGIKCEYADVHEFIKDVGIAPTKHHTIDRINNDGNYVPGNCHWVLMSVQARNKRSNVFIESNGEKKIMSDWAKELNIPISTIYNRILAGSKNPLVTVKKNWSVRFKKDKNKYQARFGKNIDGVKVSKHIGYFIMEKDAIIAAEIFVENYKKTLLSS